MDKQPKKPGRKPKADEHKKKPHPVYATDAEWSEIEKRAESAGKDVSPYIIGKALE